MHFMLTVVGHEGCSELARKGDSLVESLILLAHSPTLSVSQHCLIPDEPGSTVAFKFTTNIGMVQLFYLRSGTFVWERLIAGWTRIVLERST